MRTTVSRAFCLPCAMTLHEMISQFGILLLELVGKQLGELFQVGRCDAGCASTSRLSDQMPVGGPLAKSSATSLGASAGLPALREGRVQTGTRAESSGSSPSPASRRRCWAAVNFVATTRASKAGRTLA